MFLFLFLFHSHFQNKWHLTILQNHPDCTVDNIKKNYEPIDQTNVTETLMSIAELYGDVTYKCPVQEIAQVDSNTKFKSTLKSIKNFHEKKCFNFC